MIYSVDARRVSLGGVWQVALGQSQGLRPHARITIHRQGKLGLSCQHKELFGMLVLTSISFSTRMGNIHIW